MEELRRRVIGGFLTDGNVEAVKSSKPGAWWVMQSKDNSNEYYSIHLDSARVDTILTYSIGDTAIDGSAGGQSGFSPDGTMYARYAPRDDLFLFDFDRETGLLSHYRKIHVADSGLIGGLAFSPNSRFLYVSAHVDLYQFDTWAADIEASKVHIGHYDGYLDPFPTTFYHMQLGPDCRIYMNSNNGNRSWHLIHEPDKKGLDCRFEQHGFVFPVSNSITMPNFPNYRLDVGPVCDPGLVTSVSPAPPFDDTGSLIIYPNPTTDVAFIRLPEEVHEGTPVVLQMTDMAGKIHLVRHTFKGHSDIGIGLEDIPEGLYLFQVTAGHWRGIGRVVKQK